MSRAIHFPPFVLDLASHQLRRGERMLSLRPRSFDVLSYLAERPRRLVTKEELLDHVWHDAHVSDVVLKVCIAQIRSVLEDDARSPRVIETVRGRGYRFIAGEDPWAVPLPAAVRRPPVVGRESELTSLGLALQRALAGERQIVFVTGEVGVGKSTLVDEFLHRATEVRASELVVARGLCIEQYSRAEPFMPVIDAITRLCRQPRSEELRALLRSEAPGWYAQLPGVASPAEREALIARAMGLGAERVRRQIVEILESYSATAPIVLVLEDLHWSDESTVELLAHLAQREERARLLIIGTYRPVDAILRRHPLRVVKQELLARRRCSEIGLSMLSAAATRNYLERRFPRSDIPEAFARWLHERTMGNPLFIVSVIDQLIGDGLIAEGPDAWHLSPAYEGAGIPESLRPLVEHQIEKLDAADQRLLEAASVVGVSFSTSAVAAALSDDASGVGARCAALARRGQFIASEGIRSWADGTVAGEYRFVHPLHREVFYGRIAPVERARLHLQVGASIEGMYGEHSEEVAAELAEHFQSGGSYVRTIQYLERAARNAALRSAHREAIGTCERAIEALARIADSRRRDELELRLQMTRGASLVALQGNPAKDAERAFARARELGEKLGDAPQLLPALWALWAHFIEVGRYSEARQLAERSLAIASQQKNPELLARAHRAMTGTHLWCGELEAARRHSDESLRLMDNESYVASVSVYGPDVSGCQRALIDLLLGHPERAERAGAAAVELAERVSPPFGVGAALIWYTGLAYYGRDPHQTLQRAGRVLEFSRASGITRWVGAAHAVAGWARAQLGGAGEAMASFAEVLTPSSEASSYAPLQSVFLAACAEAQWRLGESEQALESLHRALLFAEATGERFFEAQIHRLHAQVLLDRDAEANASAAEDILRRALDVARQQSALWFELQGATLLAELLARLGRGNEARQLLGNVYCRFSEGSSHPLLHGARQLLETPSRR